MNATSSVFSNQTVVSINRTRNSHLRSPIATMDELEYDWGASVTRLLDELQRLQVGWDGYYGLPVSFANASFAQELLKKICSAETPCPQIVPGVDGDLQIEWHLQDVDIELHVIEPYNVWFWTNDEGICVNGNEIKLSTVYNSVLPVIRRLTERLDDQSAAA